MKTRRSARLVTLDGTDRVLLFKAEDDAIVVDPNGPGLTTYWFTPGGGLEYGESYEQAARRELWEETGILDIEVGPWIWTRESELVFHGARTLFYER